MKYRSEPFGKFVNVAVLEGDQIKIVDEQGGALVPDCPALVNSLLGAVERLTTGQFVNVLVQLAASMRAHGRGGAPLVVPSDTDAWRESVVAPVLYSLRPPFAELAQLMRVQTDDHEWQEDVRRPVDAVAGLTAVDSTTSSPIATTCWRLAPSSRDGVAARRSSPSISPSRLKAVHERRHADAAWRYQAPVGGAVCARSARRHRARGLAGWAFHDLQMVAARAVRARAPSRRAASLAPNPSACIADAPLTIGAPNRCGVCGITRCTMRRVETGTVSSV